MRKNAFGKYPGQAAPFMAVSVSKTVSERDEFRLKGLRSRIQVGVAERFNTRGSNKASPQFRHWLGQELWNHLPTELTQLFESPPMKEGQLIIIEA